MIEKIISGFPLHDVVFSAVTVAPYVKSPIYSAEGMQVSRNEYALQVKGVGSFYAHNGKEVKIALTPGADPEQARLWLNSQVLVALLHQRGIINFHASSFIWNDRGIMIVGETGAGKSSITASFILEGAGLLSDDLTPVVFRKTRPFIWPLGRPIKITGHTIEQLQINPLRLTPAEPLTGKQYMHAERMAVIDYPVHSIFMVQVGDVATPEFYTPEPAEKFSILRSEICSWEMLAGMPGTEAEYLEQALNIVQQAQIVGVIRPAAIKVPVLHVAISDYLEINK